MTHVVLGAGAVGTAVVNELVGRGEHVRLVSRTPREVGETVEFSVADLSDPVAAVEAVAGATVVYHCVSPTYTQWEDQFPPIHTAIIDAAAAAGARLVMADNLYMYGHHGGEPMTEHSVVAPVSGRGRLRAAMAAQLLSAHEDGRLEASIARASDIFGPHGTNSHMGDPVFGRLLAGRKAQVIGDPDAVHTYTYLPDIARSMVILALDARGLGRPWHVPSPPAISTRRFVEMIADRGDVEPGLSRMPRPVLTVLSQFNPLFRALREEQYQFEADWVMDDHRFRAQFGEAETPIDDAIDTTIAWFRQR